MSEFVEVDGALVRRDSIASAEIETRNYVNGNASWLVVKLMDGRELRREHGFGFDAFATLERIRGAGA